MLLDLLAIFFIAGLLSDGGMVVTNHEVPETELGMCLVYEN